MKLEELAKICALSEDCLTNLLKGFVDDAISKSLKIKKISLQIFVDGGTSVELAMENPAYSGPRIRSGLGHAKSGLSDFFFKGKKSESKFRQRLRFNMVDKFSVFKGGLVDTGGVARIAPDSAGNEIRYYGLNTARIAQSN